MTSIWENGRTWWYAINGEKVWSPFGKLCGPAQWSTLRHYFFLETIEKSRVLGKVNRKEACVG